MTFENWMQFKGLSLSSVKKYDGAIRGPLSEWAVDGGLIDGPLTSLDSRSAFEQVARKICELPIFIERNARGHNMYSSALGKFAEYLSEGYDSNIEADIDEILSAPEVGVTEKSALMKARIGQGAFRQKLIAYWSGCAVTRFADSSLLVASHIKPWRASSNVERLDPFNGLLLVPNLDRAFDAGYITFTPEGIVMISPMLVGSEQLGIHRGMSISLDPRHAQFLDFHRREVFRAGHQQAGDACLAVHPQPIMEPGYVPAT